MAQDDVTLSDLIEDHEQRAARLRATIAHSQEELQRLQMELEVLARIREERHARSSHPQQGRLHGFVTAAGRVAGAVVSGAAEFQNLDRVAAVERVLSMSAEPLSPSDIEVRLRAFGRDDEYDSISAALAHLKRTDRAHSPRRGEWIAGPETNERSLAAKRERELRNPRVHASRTQPGVLSIEQMRGGDDPP